MKVIVGERVTLRFEVNNVEGKDFTINNAQYTTEISGAVESSGAMTIDGSELSFLFNPLKAGIYMISVMYDIGTDRRIGRFQVEVVE